MTRRQRPRRHVWAAALLAAALCVPAAVADNVAEAAVPKLDQIRVALYITNGKTYNSTVPAVTLSSPAGLDAGVRTPSGVRVWTVVPPGVQARFAADGYNVLLLETADANAAKTLAQALAATQDKPAVFRAAKLGQTVYRVYAGPYATKEEATAAKQRIAAGGAAAALPKGGTATVTGPHRWSAGTFPSEAAARQQADALRLKGVDAWVVATEAAGQLAFAVWIGEAADAEQASAAKAQAEKLVPGLALLPVDAAAPYLLQREDVTGPTAAVTHYAFNPNEQKVWISPKDGVTAVAEKGGRQYRGNLELSRHNGKLAVVNELPFEQYLVSVVGGEMSDGWPAEALKAQAVSARTFALAQGLKYQIAHVSDSTADQAYYGVEEEGRNVSAAVAATAGEVLTANGQLITPFFYSNGGGMTGDPVEVWGQPIPYLKATASPDEGAQAGKPQWYKVAMANGTVGYVRSDLVTDSGTTNAAGLKVVTVKGTGVSIRPAPYVDNANNAAIATVNAGERLVALGTTPESNAYGWVRGPYKADVLLKELNGALASPIAGPLSTLAVSKRGPSGRAVELEANGRPVPVAKPDQYRGALFDAPSTRFEIEETGRYTVLGANGQTRSLPESAGALYAVGASGTASALAKPGMIVLGGGGAVRDITKDPQFRLVGKGYGHGLGMSQWGARGLAEAGTDYKGILHHYYTGVTIAKD
ncbi:SpoIID/LytB domain-containing protein [Paenibacillus flagellatus]|uniref:SPOR domain-containing protein n=1 Tax=Paenibacillus flagellatus TaxID=2211139 RepID=A0A2V5K298_9BACL|nr:SpoIID/LytB domain-containing protein [Paenibacillus flagellatus]PYI53309.1 hypothetical protein DLM86_16105 [Paenibacillus flagellatus]